MSRAVNMLIDNIEKIIIGKRIVIEHLLVALLSDGQGNGINRPLL